MNFNMNIPGLKGVEISKIEELETGIVLHVSMPSTSASMSSL